MNYSNFSNYDHLFKVLVLGAKDSGKTNLILRYADDTYTGLKQQIADYKLGSILEINNKNIKLKIYEEVAINTAKNFKNWNTLLNVNCIILTFDVNNKESFELAKSQGRKLINQNTNDNKVVIRVVGCKSDLEESKWQVTKDEVGALVKMFNEDGYQYAGYSFVSAKNGTNIEECFTECAKSIFQQHDSKNILKYSLVNIFDERINELQNKISYMDNIKSVLNKSMFGIITAIYYCVYYVLSGGPYIQAEINKIEELKSEVNKVDDSNKEQVKNKVKNIIEVHEKDKELDPSMIRKWTEVIKNDDIIIVKQK